MAALRAPCRRLVFPRIGGGLVGRYHHGPGSALRFEGDRPGPGWHRHDWRPVGLLVVDDVGVRVAVVERRRWRQAGTTTTQLDRCPDEVGGARVALAAVLLRLAAWLLSGDGLHVHEAPAPALDRVACPRTLQRWLARLLPDDARVQGALRTAVIERSDAKRGESPRPPRGRGTVRPQPVERLFPGGVSPPEAIRRRRWKDPEAAYRLATGLAFLVEGAVALSLSATVLLAVAQTRLDGPLGILRT